MGALPGAVKLLELDESLVDMEDRTTKNLYYFYLLSCFCHCVKFRIRVSVGHSVRVRLRDRVDIIKRAEIF